MEQVWARRVRPRSPAATLALGLSILVILVATLLPRYETASAEGPFCLLCGGRGAADAIDNMLLFTPLGFTLGLIRLNLIRAVLAGACLSAFVEITQFAIIPGRDATISDLVFNTLGAALGYMALRMTLRPLLADSRLAAWLSPLAAAVAIAAIALTGYLLSPSFPKSRYAGQWTESPGNLELYQGTILEATLGSTPVPARPLEAPEEIRNLLRAEAPLDIRLIAGPPTRRLGQLFAIVEHGSQREVLLLGIHGDDLILRYRTRGNDLRFDAGTLRVTDALASMSPGSAVRLVMWGEPDGYCVSVNGKRACELAFTAANGWMVLYSVASWPVWLRDVFSAAWLAALFLPVGFWWRRSWPSFLALLVMSIGLALLPGAVGLSPPSAIESAGAALGLLLGKAASLVISKRLLQSIRPVPAGTIT